MGFVDAHVSSCDAVYILSVYVFNACRVTLTLSSVRWHASQTSWQQSVCTTDVPNVVNCLFLTLDTPKAIIVPHRIMRSWYWQLIG